ncbi:MAG: flagellar hook-length control protein FliK, partial [Firmicutes bacterium]|nr:flagellar hook-length control protein FliK [Bacillota bacterium]
VKTTGDGGERVTFNTLADNSQPLKTPAAAETVTQNREAHVPKQEIINQVIDRAKVVLNGEKSEMVIDLKPDHLGRLSLKVVTEHGMVAAKIVAENQQVKQVLESNMQLLKDSLEKQGMVIQGFSVSVRDDSSKSLFGRDAWGQQRKGNTPGAPYPGGVLSASELTDSTERINPYYWSGSSINLTA